MSFKESCKWIDSRQEDLLNNLMRLSEINSGTSNLEGIRTVADYFRSYFSGTADSISEIQSQSREHTDISGNKIKEEFGNLLSFKKRTEAPIQVLLAGHMDTVFPLSHSFQTPKKLDENTLLGPGVADMKGGILVMLTALQAYEASNHSNQLGWRVILNADEETGSHGSVETLEAAATTADVGLIYEPALADGTLSRARKGSGNFTVVATGQAAHAGREYDQGRNAIMGLYSAAQKLEQLTELENGITVNIARISGGTAFNVVPAAAVLQFNVRCQSVDQQHELDAKMKAVIHETAQQSEVALEISGGFSRPPKSISPANQLLMDWVVESGKQLDIDVQFKDTGGCCDGNNLAAVGLPNVDTLGVLGGQIHTADEFMLINSLTERAKLSLNILQKISEEGDRLQALSKRDNKN